MKNFQGIIFIWIRTYREIFKSAWVYLLRLIFKRDQEWKNVSKTPDTVKKKRKW